MYSPKIKPEFVIRIYKLKQSRKDKKPMTFYINEAIEQYLEQQEILISKDPNSTGNPCRR